MPETFQRINPADVPAMFLAKAIIPAQGDWAYSGRETGECFCCMIGILIANELSSFDKAQEFFGYDRANRGDILDICRAATPILGVLASYAIGLNDGWEQITREWGWDNTDEYEAGCEDGRASLRACVAAGLIEPEEEIDEE